MDSRWQPLEKDAVKAVELLLYPREAGPAQILDGVAPAANLTPFASRLEQSESQLTFTLSWHRELDGAQLPSPGQWVLVNLDAQPLCIQQIDSLGDYRIVHGVKQLTVTARSRDATARWRERTIATPAYAIGAPTIGIVMNVAEAMGLRGSEVLVGRQLAAHVPRANLQLANVPAWTALEQVMLPAGLSPAIDALGRLRGYARDVLREADVVLSDERIESFSGSRASAPITRLSLKWRSPQMVTIKQSERVLAETTMTAGFFRLRQIHRVYFSEDRTLRATDLRMVIKESANRLLNVCDEEMDWLGHDSADDTGAAVVVTTRNFVPAILGSYVFMKVYLAGVSDGATPAVTIPYGRVLEAAGDVAILLLLVSFGQGTYQILGRPLDAVEEVNETVAYAPDASPASQKLENIESDFIVSESAAQAFVTREFIYRCRAATSFTLTIVDDPRLEVGDIVQFADGMRLFVTGFRRDLSPGSAALLQLSGFPA